MDLQTTDRITTGDRAAPIVDVQATLRRWGNDKSVVQQLFAIFLKNADTNIASLTAALNAGDAAEVERIGHAQKGAADYVGAKGVRSICAAMETLARAGDLSAARALLADLRGEVARCEAFDFDAAIAEAV